MALTHLPGLEGEKALGWVQQPWIKLGSSISIFQETKLGLSGVIASVILVAIVYVFSSNLIMMYARKKEFAVLLALGWRPSQLSKMLFLESTILGLIVAFISWGILGLFLVTNSIETSGIRILLIGVSGLSIYLLGALIPAWLVQKIRPYETMKSGEISNIYKRIVKAESVFGMSINYLFTQWKRSILSIVAIAVPTSLFIFFLFVTFRLKGVLYSTWLGEFVALEVGTMHYVAMGVALLIAVLTTAEIMWQNVAERQPQIAVLKAVGWHNKQTRLLVLFEGLICGVIAGIVGLGIALFIIFTMYGQFPTNEMTFLVGTLIIPVITGIVGAILPAEKAVGIQPYLAISGGLTNSKKTEKHFKVVFSFSGSALFVGVLILLMLSIPDLEKNSTHKVATHSDSKTEGEMIEVSKKTNEKVELPLEEEEKPVEESDAFAELKSNAWKVLSLGENTNPDDKPFRPTLTFGELTKPLPNLHPENPENTLLSIPVTLKEESEDEFSYIFKPQLYKLFDEDGNKYLVKDVETIKGDSWNNLRVFMPGEVSVVVTFEVPKSHGKLVLFIDTLEYAEGTVVVDIPPATNSVSPGKIQPGASGNYYLDVVLDKSDIFHISAEIDVVNESQDSWKDIGFYFIPNAFTEKYKPEFLLDKADVSITSIISDGKDVPYELTNSKLLLKLGTNLVPSETKTVKIDYTLKIPDNGVRLSKINQSFFLAQWYPMLGHYQEEGWNIKDFDAKGESYHTSYGNYEIKYNLPDHYLVVSSGDEGKVGPSSSGVIKGENIKDFYLALLKPDHWSSKSTKVNDTTIRLFVPANQSDIKEKMSLVANEAFSYFEEKLGDNPTKELDIIANNGGMEYPNVVEVNDQADYFENTLVHEIAHQWFYYIVSNDPYKDAWLDEGITTFATSLFLSNKYGDENLAFELPTKFFQSVTPSEKVNIPLDRFQSEYISTVYGKTPLLLRDFFKEHGGQEEAIRFLSAYFNEFQFKYVDSQAFAAFFNDYFEEDFSEFLEGWLELE
ncbi:FtsX-like permease family protein [Paenisporosarcina sp. NPDC076898]|uniref:FtsX-like permease family protein n=1 Tax=unclassified Paenisporosarcina TaxID=2642018 RepID=UPI003D046768